MAPPLITITRQYASGGSDIAQLVARALGWTVIDNEFVDEVARRAGLPGLQFRDLRRTAATALHDNGVRLKTISAMLGHATTSTTERYLGLRAENLQAAGKILGMLYQPPKDEPAATQSDHKSDHMASEIEAKEFANIVDY